MLLFSWTSGHHGHHGHHVTHGKGEPWLPGWLQTTIKMPGCPRDLSETIYCIIHTMTGLWEWALPNTTHMDTTHTYTAHNYIISIRLENVYIYCTLWETLNKFARVKIPSTKIWRRKPQDDLENIFLNFNKSAWGFTPGRQKQNLLTKKNTRSYYKAT